MRLIPSVLVALAIASLALAEQERGKVVELTPESFGDVVNGETNVMVEFFAPWCGHCKRLAPEYAKAAKALGDLGNPGVLASVDCTQHKDLCSRFGVRGYPTVLFFEAGVDVTKPTPYRGKREAQALVDAMPKFEVKDVLGDEDHAHEAPAPAEL